MKVGYQLRPLMPGLIIIDKTADLASARHIVSIRNVIISLISCSYAETIRNYQVSAVPDRSIIGAPITRRYQGVIGKS
jgi:hypothetical protein